jgi:hypothetical protein
MSKSKKKQPNYEELGRLITRVYETGYINLKQSLKMSFLKGVASGIGGVVGATLVLAILVWILSLFQQIPLIGPLLESINSTIKQSR